MGYIGFRISVILKNLMRYYLLCVIKTCFFGIIKKLILSILIVVMLLCTHRVSL